MNTKPSDKHYNEAKKEEVKGSVQATGDSIAEKAHLAAANVKETFGYDGTEQRAKAAECQAEKKKVMK